MVLPFDFNHKLPPAGAEVQQPQWAEKGGKCVFVGKIEEKKAHLGSIWENDGNQWRYLDFNQSSVLQLCHGYGSVYVLYQD